MNRNPAWSAAFALLLLTALPAAAAEPAADPATRRWAQVAGRMLFGVSQLRSLRLELTTTTRMGGSVETMSQILEIELPDKFRRTVLIGGQEQVVVVNGGRGFMGAAGQVLPLPEPQLRQTLEQLRRNLLVLAAGAGSDETKVVSGGTEKVGELMCDVLDLSYGTVSSRLYVTEDGEVIEQVFRGNDPMSGAAGVVEIVYTNYRELAGVRYPVSHAIFFDGSPLVIVEIGNLEINPELSPALFAVGDAQ